MKKIKTFGIALLTACVLTACGGGGGGSANNKNNSSNATPVNPTHSAKSFDNRTGGVITFSDKLKKPRYQEFNNKDNFKSSIIVDGQKIDIELDSYSNDYSAEGWTILAEGHKETFMCCESYNYVRFGMIDEGDDNGGAVHFYYNGIPSRDLPTGKAKYIGHFLLIDDSSEDIDYLGQANFNVDFSAKNLSGELTNKKIKPIHISATIKGNAFEGSASSAGLQKARVEGKFYGPQAKELGGIFDNGKDWSGAFGAKKQ